MRTLGALALLALAGCGTVESEESDESVSFGLEAGTWTDGEQSGLCSAADGSAAFILYDDDSRANCMAEGRLGEVDGGLVFVPRGDEQCRIPIDVEGEALRFGEPGEGCAYYCGGDTRLAGRTLEREDATERVLTDPAGGKVC